MRVGAWVVEHKTLRLSMRCEMKHLQAHVRRNSIEPANEQVEGETYQFVIRKRAPFDLCTTRKAESVIGRIVPPLVEFAAQKIDDRSRRCRHGRQVRGMQQADFPLQEFWSPLQRKAHQFQEHLDGKFERKSTRSEEHTSELQSLKRQS